MKLLLILVALVAVLADNPEENANLFEGDMILSPEQIEAAMNGDISKTGSKAAHTGSLWSNRVVPYTIDSSVSGARSYIKQAISAWEGATCIRFKERSYESGYIAFSSGSGCSSAVGKTGSRQQISLARGCWQAGIIIHEIGHALGFYHEQSRPDRDSYVEIIWANIKSGMEFNFNKYGRGTIDSLGEPYDYGSIMHYQKNAFSTNGRDTIKSKRGNQQLGNRYRLTSSDIKQMNKLYKCNGGGGDGGGGGGGDCKDINAACPSWSGLGFCTGHYGEWMKANCKKSCSLC